MGCYVVRCLFGFIIMGRHLRDEQQHSIVSFFCFGKVPPHGEVGKQTRQLSAVLRDEWEFKRWSAASRSIATPGFGQRL